MSKFQTLKIDGEQGRDYDHEYIMANPIPARCKKCKRTFTDGKTERVVYFRKIRRNVMKRVCINGKWERKQVEIEDFTPAEKTIVSNDAIRAPALSGCRCFYCHGELGPLEKGGPVTVEQVEQQESMRKNQPRLQLY